MNALVMYDHQTHSLWSQFLGQAVEGPQRGVKLDFVPVVHTRWSLWRDAHPDTRVLDKKGRYRRDSYASYYPGGSAGVLGEALRDGRLPRKALVVGVEVHGHSKAYAFSVLADVRVVNDSFAGDDLLVYFEGETRTALVYRRSVGGQVLEFSVAPQADDGDTLLTDGQTGSVWDGLTGLALRGPLAGEVLSRPVSHLAFWFAWKDWNPDTEVYSRQIQDR